jgi:N-acetylglucosaminyl-diphospho-decaprenol L-rhamnosyltransferase
MSAPAGNLEGLTAIVLNWRTPELTLKAARALIDDGVPAHRIVLVDNGSGDGSAERLGAELPEAVTLALPDNLGFAAANNRAAASLEAKDGYLLVNSDAFVLRAGSVGRLLAALDDPTVAVAVPRLRNPDGSLQPSVYPLSTPLPELVRASGLSRLIPDRLAPALGAHWSHNRSCPVQSAVGAVLLVRAAAWRALGGLDERRFMYAEDLELFWRVRRRGWVTWFEAGAEFTHLGGASSASAWSDAARARRVASAEAAMLRAQMGPFRSRATLLAMAGGVAARAAVNRARGRDEAARVAAAWTRGYLLGLRGRGLPPEAER